MQLHKLSAEEVRSWDLAKRQESVDEVRRELSNLRMDVYTAKSQHSSKIRGLKKSLARLLTERSQDVKKTAKVAASAKAPAKTKAKTTETKPKVKSKGGKK